MKDLVIVGAGGHGKEVAFLINQINSKSIRWNLLGFVDKFVGKTVGKYKVVFSDEKLLQIEEPIDAVIAIGNPKLLERLSKTFISNQNISFPNLFFPGIIGDWENIILGIGNMFCASTVFTTDIKIGSFNIINRGVIVSHDVEIGDYNVINPSVTISGGVKIGNGCLIGAGVTILQYVSICDNVTIGAGAVVTKDIKKEGTYIGIPAKRI